MYENDKHVKSTVSVQRAWHKLVEVIPFTARLSQKLRSQSSTTKELQSSTYKGQEISEGNCGFLYFSKKKQRNVFLITDPNENGPNAKNKGT